MNKLNSKQQRPVLGRKASAALFFLVSLTLLTTAGWSSASAVVLKEGEISVYFSPEGGATEALIKEISRGKKEILVQAYSLSSLPIVTALLAAHQRGLAVKIIMDKSERGEGLTPAVVLSNAGVAVFLDGKHALAHSSCLIIDQQIVLTGSFNYTKASEESNAEDLLIIRSTQMAQQYRDYWEKHRAHSEPH
ncbi:MAG: phospholipase D family protein [Desulfobacca sp.]|nr:phospholipase D family protein [Desulfobacca sp.]